MSMDVASCEVCFENLVSSDDFIVSIPCGHVFHCRCLLQWRQTSPYCPKCRCKYNKNEMHRLFVSVSEEKVHDECNQNKKSLENKLEEIGQARDKLRSQLTTLRTQMRTLELKIMSLEKENKSLTEAEKLQNQVVASNKKELSNLKIARDKCLKELEELNCFRDCLRGPSNVTNSAAGSGTLNTEQLTTVLTLLQKETEVLRRRLERLNGDYVTSLNEIDILTKLTEDKDEQIKTLSSKNREQSSNQARCPHHDTENYELPPPPPPQPTATTSTMMDMGPMTIGMPGPSTMGPVRIDMPGPSTMGPVRIDMPGPSRIGPMRIDMPGPSRMGPVRIDMPGPSAMGPMRIDMPGPSTGGPMRIDMPGPSAMGPMRIDMPGPSWATGPYYPAYSDPYYQVPAELMVPQYGHYTPYTLKRRLDEDAAYAASTSGLLAVQQYPLMPISPLVRNQPPHYPPAKVILVSDDDDEDDDEDDDDELEEMGEISSGVRLRRPDVSVSPEQENLQGGTTVEQQVGGVVVIPNNDEDDSDEDDYPMPKLKRCKLSTNRNQI